LKEIGDNVGRERILVMHGMEDKMITPPHGRVLIDELQPGMSVLKPGVGHVFMLEDSDFHDATVEQLWAKAAALK
jgi:pimeloyl-ACP methyl ester carboxylesterase